MSKNEVGVATVRKRKLSPVEMLEEQCPDAFLRYTPATGQDEADALLVNLSKLYPNVTELLTVPLFCTAALWRLIQKAARACGNDGGGTVWDICFMDSVTGRWIAPRVRRFEVHLYRCGAVDIKTVIHYDENSCPVATYKLASEA